MGALLLFDATAHAATCDNAVIREQQHAVGLSDCRAYEKVSPADKAGADVNGDALRGGSTGEARAAVLGDAVAYSSFGSFADAQGAAWPSWYRAVRGPSGWSSSSLTPAAVAGGQPPANTAGVTALTEDLSEATVFTNAPLVPSAPPGIYNLFLQDNDTGTHKLVTNLGPPPSLLPPAPMQVGASADLSHVFFISTANLTTDAVGFSNKLYESVDGEVRLAGIGPAPADEPMDGVFPGSARSVDRAVSEDGSRIYFIGPDGILYMREDGETTIRVSPSGALGGFTASDQFYTATPDGSSVLYASTFEAAGGALETRLLRTDVETKTTETVSDQEFFAPLKASDDLQDIYFLTGTTLGTTMWVWHAGISNQIAEIPPGDALSEEAIVSPYIAPNNALSGDGQTFLFVSQGSYTDYDNQGRREVYRYQPETETVDCISCPPSESPPAGDASLVDWFFRSTNNLPATSLWNGPEPGHRWRNISADQERIFFNSSDRLVPEDTNGKIDVYQWQAGKVALVSSGTGKNDARFMNASASGDDVFFVTRNRLVASDIDELVDMYDARAGGGFAEPESPPLPCVGELCQGPAQSSPTPAASGTSVFAGPGNPRSPTLSVAIAGKTKNSVTVKVKASQAGVVTLSGPAVVKRTQRVDAARTYPLKGVLTDGARGRLQKKGSVKVKLTVAFKPTSGTGTSKTVPVTFRTAKARASSRVQATTERGH